MTQRDPNLPELDSDGYCTACEFRHPCECVEFCETCCEPMDECLCEEEHEEDPEDGFMEPDDWYDGPDVDYIYTPPHLYM